MEIKILQVFYDKNGLPYKDKERAVHYPITSGTFLGASNTTQIRFYYDQLDELNESTFVAISKLPNGRIGSEILESEYDSELEENYAVLNLSQFYTQYKGDVYISLQGYEGGVRVEQDENGIYSILGTPTIAATGSIRMYVAYAPTFIGSGQTENVTLQRVLAELSTKLGIRQETLHVEELPTVGNPNVWYVINDDEDDHTKANIYIWNAKTQTYVWVGDNTLNLGDYYTQGQGEQFEEEIENRVSSVENELSSVAQGSPKGVYNTLEDLQTAFPTGADGIYLVSADGHWYYWNGSAWTDGGTYLEGPADNELSESSTNPVQNKVIAKEINNFLDDYYNDPIYEQNTDIEILTGKTVLKSNGSLFDDAGGRYTDYVDATVLGTVYVDGFSQYSTCIIATYDENHTFIRAYGKGNDAGVTWSKEKFTPKEDEKYVRFSSYSNIALKVYNKVYSPKLPDVENSINEQIDTNKLEFQDITSSLTLRDGFYNKYNGNFNSYSGSKATDKIAVSEGDKFKISADARYDTCMIATYNSSGTFLRNYGPGSDSLVVWNQHEYTVLSDEKYVAFSTFDNSQNPLKIEKYQKLFINKQVAELEEKLDDEITDTRKGNVLYGKKYVACGDSFTAEYANDSINLIGKTYPNLIANRNGMVLHNMGVSGIYAHYGNEGFTNPAKSYYYQNIDADADYITIALGLNETGTTLGNSSSTDNTTIWGAYNEVLSWLIANRPNAKIGIISNDAWMTKTFRDTLKSIAAYWGVSFLDLKEYRKPLMIGGKFTEDGPVSSVAVSSRNALYQVTQSNDHPNEAAHKVRSTIIEEWMRGM